MDYLLKHEMAEATSLTQIFKLQHLQSPQKIIRRSLEMLKAHGFLVENEIKKKVFIEKYLPKLLGCTPPKEEREPTGNVSVYCFNVDIMLVIKARLFMLHKLVNEKVRMCWFESF